MIPAQRLEIGVESVSFPSYLDLDHPTIIKVRTFQLQRHRSPEARDGFPGQLMCGFCDALRNTSCQSRANLQRLSIISAPGKAEAETSHCEALVVGFELTTMIT